MTPWFVLWCRAIPRIISRTKFCLGPTQLSGFGVWDVMEMRCKLCGGEISISPRTMSSHRSPSIRCPFGLKEYLVQAPPLPDLNPLVRKVHLEMAWEHTWCADA